MSLIKIANAAIERQRFLEEYGVKDPSVFSKDTVAQEAVDSLKGKATNQINDFFKNQEKLRGSLSPEAQKLQRTMVSDLDSNTTKAVQNFSIDRTRATAAQNPTNFKNFHRLSTNSERALNQSHGKEVGTTLGAVGGAGLGLLLGKKLPKNNSGLLQKTIGASTGALAGGATGNILGANRDEKRTGYNHEDVLAPYQIADRIENRQNFR